MNLAASHGLSSPVATAPTHNSYDQVPNLNRAHIRTHPDRAAALATLLGLDPPPLECRRILVL